MPNQRAVGSNLLSPQVVVQELLDQFVKESVTVSVKLTEEDGNTKKSQEGSGLVTLSTGKNLVAAVTATIRLKLVPHALEVANRVTEAKADRILLILVAAAATSLHNAERNLESADSDLVTGLVRYFNLSTSSRLQVS